MVVTNDKRTLHIFYFYFNNIPTTIYEFNHIVQNIVRKHKAFIPEILNSCKQKVYNIVKMYMLLKNTFHISIYNNKNLMDN